MAKNKNKGSKIARANSKGLSGIGDFNHRLHLFLQKVKMLNTREVSVGWVDSDKEQTRSKPKSEALAINAKRKKKKLKGRCEIVSNVDADFIGPGIKAASMATIAKVMNYGMAGGVSKDGRQYGAIPARPFVQVLYKKFMNPIQREQLKMATNTMSKNVPPQTLQQQLTSLGVVAKGQLQRAMKDSNSYVANAPITIKGGWMTNPKNGKPFHVEPKGSSRPLWNKGTLINSVDFEIK